MSLLHIVIALAALSLAASVYSTVQAHRLVSALERQRREMLDD